MINSYNPIQLSAWHANVDMQYIVSRRRVLQYCTKYMTKSEPQSQRSSPPLFVVSEKATPLSRQCRSYSSTLWERGTILLKKPATYFCSCPCSRHLMISSSSALMGLILLKTDWRRGSVPQHSPLSTTTWDALTLLSSTACHCWSLPDNTPCPRPWELSQLTEADVLLSSLGHMSHLILLVTSMNSTVANV